MDFQFNLPSNNDDLLNSSSDHYYVKHLYNVNELPEKLLICKQVLFQGDPFYIFDYFDTYYAIIQIKAIDSKSMVCLSRAFDLLYVTIDKLGNNLMQFLSSNEHENDDDPSSGSPANSSASTHGRQSYLNLTKMIMFLMVNVVRKIELSLNSLQQQQQPFQAKKRGRGGKVAVNLENNELSGSWDDKRQKFLIQLYNVLQFPLEKLWSPPIAEENFVSLLCDICYRILEIVHSRSDNNAVIETIFQIFGTAIKRYQHGINFPVKILQILRSVEHAGLSIAMGINVLHEEFGISSVLPVLIKEIIQSLRTDAADSAVSRNFANFLTELASISPTLMIPQLTSLLCDELLNCESYVVRNCMLQIMGDAILSEFTSEDLSEDMKNTRNEFLENLLMHINDISAHVRCKVLQIWNHLRMEQAVPLTYQLNVLSGAIERLEDKTSTVRKHAVQLIKSFLERNIFSANLTLAELEKKHAEEVEKMEKLSEIVVEERAKAQVMDEKWTLLVPEILPFIEENLKTTHDFPETNETYENMVQCIWNLIVDKKYEQAVILVRKADHAVGNSEISMTLKYEEQCAYFMTLLKSYMFLANGCKDSNESLGTQIKTVTFLQDSIKFSKMVAKAMPKLQEMLLSKTNSDVFEAVDLFTTGYMFGIKGTEDGMHSMLNLVWSADKEKRDSVLAAYMKVLFATDQQGRAHALRVAHNLSHFLESLDYGHYLAMECLVAEWVRKGDIDSLIVQMLFEIFTKKLEGTSDNEARLALQLLIMCSMAKPSIASANINIIESIGFGERGRRDPRLYSACLEFLMNSVDKETRGSKFYNRFEPDSNIVQNVNEMYRKLFFYPKLPEADKITMSTIQFFYEMCQTPDLLCHDLILHFVTRFKCIVDEFSTKNTQQDTESVFFSQAVITSTQETTPIAAMSGKKLPVYLLCRFIFLIGYIALKELIFLDMAVYNNMNLRQELTKLEKRKAKLEKSNMHFNALKLKQQHKTNIRNSMNTSATESLKRLSLAAVEPQQEPDEDLVGATAEDNVAEMINHICEDVLLLNSSKSILPRVLLYIVDICKFPLKYNHPELQQSACLALIRFMCVSSQICEQYMPFLMSLLEKSQNIKLRCNIVTSLSDLTFRFPNVMEPWSNHFYAILHDNNIDLRLTAVKTLSYLIQHEMIRVKGQIATLALCIIDENEEIMILTKQFFKVIANKSNILYNVLPDIISKLSDVNFQLEEEKYRTIMRYILSLIQKDRQVETLVDKLCLRFAATQEERQWRDVAFCLSLLNYNERSLRKLIDNIQYYKDIVIIDEIYQLFKLIIANTMKFLQKAEVKALLTELETRINECFKVHEENEQQEGSSADDGSTTLPPRAGKGKGKQQRGPGGSRRNKSRRGGGGGGRHRSRRYSSSSGEESSDSASNTSGSQSSEEQGVVENAVANGKDKQKPDLPKNRSSRNVSRKQQSESTPSEETLAENDYDDDEDDDDVFEENPVKLNRKQKNTSAMEKSRNSSVKTRANTSCYKVIEEETESSDELRQLARQKKGRKHT